MHASIVLSGDLTWTNVWWRGMIQTVHAPLIRIWRFDKRWWSAQYRVFYHWSRLKARRRRIPQSMVIQLTAKIEYFTRSCIIIRTERVEIWRRQLTQFIIVPGWSLTQLSSSRQTTKSSGTDMNSKVILISTSSQLHNSSYACFISNKGLTLSTQGLVPFYHPSNPEPSLLSKWCCNDVCNQSRNRISRQKYWTSNKCCGCCVLTAVVCCCLLLRRPQQATNYQQKDVHKVSFVEQMNMSKW